MYARAPKPGPLGYCWACDCDVQSATIDVITDHEFGMHVQTEDVCPECGERVSEPKKESEEA